MADTVVASDVKAHCPFGCKIDGVGEDGLPVCDERGYCKHLVGFTNDKKNIECVRKNARGHVQVTQSLRDTVKESDRLVNPQFTQIDGGIKRLAYEWVSWRVYRREAREEMTEEELERLTAPVT